MADGKLLKDYYIESDSRDSTNKCIDPPLAIARTLSKIKVKVYGAI
jgi:hypothetical protein